MGIADRRAVRRVHGRGLSSGLLALALIACSPGDARVQPLTVEDPAAQWFAGDDVRLVPPVHLPSSDRAQAQVEIWMRAADGGIGLRRGDDGVDRLAFGPGTRGDRLEFAGHGEARRIVDVRGTEIDEAGSCWFHVLRPADEAPGGPLVGVRWPCDDPEADAAATAAMRERLPSLPELARAGPQARARAIAGFVARNDCGGCHLRARPEATHAGQYGAVHRGTDASGFFTPQSLLVDSAPIEAYGAFDPNLDDPAIVVTCPADDLERHGRAGGGTRMRCADGRVPIARLDWASLRDRDPSRARAICDGRRWLLDHMDDAAHARHAAVIEPCREIFAAR